MNNSFRDLPAGPPSENILLMRALLVQSSGNEFASFIQPGEEKGPDLGVGFRKLPKEQSGWQVGAELNA